MASDAELYRYVTTHLAQAKCARASSVELFERVVKSNDSEAFSALTQRHGPEVYRWCMFFLRNQADAEDLFQDVFLTLWTKSSKVRDASKLDAWLFRIVRNKAFNRLRSRKYVTTLDAIEPPASLQSNSCDHAVSKEQLEIVMRELGSLRSEYQEALLLTKVQGLSLQAAAEQMGRPIGTVSTFINRGLEELVQRLKRYQIELSLPALAVVYSEASATVSPELLKQTMTLVLTPTTTLLLKLAIGSRLFWLGLLTAGLLTGAATIYYWMRPIEEAVVAPPSPIVTARNVSNWNRQFFVESAIPRIMDELKKLVAKQGNVRLVSFTETPGPTYHAEFQLLGRANAPPGSFVLSCGIRWHYHEPTGGIRCETDAFCQGAWTHAAIDYPLCFRVGNTRIDIPLKPFRACEVILRELKSNPPPLIHPGVKAEIENDPKWRTIRRLVGYWHDPNLPTDRRHLIYIGPNKEPYWMEPSGVPIGGTILILEGDELQLHSSPGKFLLSEDGKTLKGSGGGEWKKVGNVE